MTVRTFLPDILEEHLEEVDFLWSRWLEAIRSAEYGRHDVADLEERIRAHLSGVSVVGEGAIPMLTDWLGQDSVGATFAGARGLLELRRADAEQRVLDSVRRLRGSLLEGIRWALCHGPLSAVGLKVLRSLVEGPDEMAAVAAEALAYHGQLEIAHGRLLSLLESDDPAVRAAGWRLIGATRTTTTAHHFAQALRDDVAAVRTAAMEAGAWCGVPGVLVACRMIAERPSPEHLELLELLAAIATLDDFQVVSSLVSNQELGPRRFRLAAAYGHPALVEMLFDAMEKGDPPAAAEAGQAFQRLTGRKLEWGPGSDPDGPEIPDGEEARLVWAGSSANLGSATRICRGVDVEQPIDPAVFEAFDMRSRWETFLRSRYHGAWDGSPLALTRFPQAT